MTVASVCGWEEVAPGGWLEEKWKSGWSVVGMVVVVIIFIVSAQRSERGGRFKRGDETTTE
jgi:hypothetical protein